MRHMAELAYETLDKDAKDTLQAFADGINDCVLGTGLMKKQTTSRLLPPEFYTFGLSDLKKWRPWSPVDTIALLKYKSFYLSWNWMHDMGREALRQKHPDLADFAEELNPFTSDNFMDLVTIIDDDDLKAIGQYSEKTLLERYHENLENIKKASPPLPPDSPSIQLRNSDTSQKRKIPTSVTAAKV